MDVMHDPYVSGWVESVQLSKRGKPLVRTNRGIIEFFDKQKIVDSLLKETALAIEHYPDLIPLQREEAEELAEKIYRKYIKRLPFVSGPLIRELICAEMLLKATKEPRYAIYRNFYTRIGMPIYDYIKIMEGRGFEARENANSQPNPETLHKKVADKAAKEANLLAVIPPYLADAHMKKRIHIHDLEYFATRPFCQNHDLRYFFFSGLLPDGVGARTSVAGPAKHPEVAILHSVKALASAQTNWAGGQGWYNYTLFFAPYMRGLPYERIKQLAQMLFFEHTQAYVARGGQLLFASIEMPPGVPKIFRDIHVVMGGKVLSDVYGDYEDETRSFFKALCEVAMAGDKWGKPFFFPKMEIVYDKEFMTPEYDDCYLAAAKLTSKYGIPYFENKIPGYRSGGDGGVRLGCYQCCSYDQASSPKEDPEFWDKLNFVDGKHFSWGAVQVVSLNMPQHAYIAKGNDSLLWEEIEKTMRMSIDNFQIKKRLVEKQMKNGLLPFMTMQPKVNGLTMPPLVDVKTLRYIIGLVGVNEMVQFHVGEQLHESNDALRFALRTVVEMEKIRKELEEESGLLLAIARTPAESCAQSMAVADLIHYPQESRTVVKGDLKTWDQRASSDGTDAPIYYSNGTHTNVAARISLSEKLRIEQPFWALMSGGNMFHIWLGEANPDPEAIARLTRKLAEETQLGYFAFTKDLTTCENCNVTSPGLRDSCPNCNSENVEWYSRITGYYQSVGKNGGVAGWNAAKRQELLDRYRVRGGTLYS
jgi:anaerobic ribonucleoside-triphosphate reductase